MTACTDARSTLPFLNVYVAATVDGDWNRVASGAMPEMSLEYVFPGCVALAVGQVLPANKTLLLPPTLRHCF